MIRTKPSSLVIWFKRGAAVLVALILLAVALFAGIIIIDNLAGHDTAEFANVEYVDASGNQLLGYLATPEGPGPHPAVLLIHEWWGLNEGMTVLADALAGEGYLVFAPDGYRGNVTALIPRAL